MLRGIANQRDGWKYFIQEKFVFNVFNMYTSARSLFQPVREIEDEETWKSEVWVTERER